VAQVIEFYVPAHFQKRVMWIPHEQRGKVIVFRTDLIEITFCRNLAREILTCAGLVHNEAETVEVRARKAICEMTQ
jgi:hypothetical protein